MRRLVPSLLGAFVACFAVAISAFVAAPSVFGTETQDVVLREADALTMDDFQTVLDTSKSSRAIGRLWSDKTVFAKGEQSGDFDGQSLTLDEETDGVTDTVDLNSDFLHAYSVEGEESPSGQPQVLADGVEEDYPDMDIYDYIPPVRRAAYSASMNDVLWGVVDGVVTTEPDGVTTWDVSATQKRYLDVPVIINVSGIEEVVVELPKSISENVRSGGTPIEGNYIGATAMGWELSEDAEKVTLSSPKSQDGDHHGTALILYRFDCWDVLSGTEFDINYKLTTDKTQQGTLRGAIITDHDVSFDDPYFFDWGTSAYSLGSLGGTDKYTSYAREWAPAYKKYFGFEKTDFDGDTYFYDVVPFLVTPKGQQPYDIEGTLSLDQGGQIVGGIYMMDSSIGGTSMWKSLDVGLGDNSFTLPYSNLERKVVTGNLTDPVDNLHYTLYFLVRYPKSSLDTNSLNVSTWKDDYRNFVKISANLSLTHTGVDNKEPKTVSTSQVMYQGPLEAGQTIYWESPVNENVNNRKALTAFSKGDATTSDVAFDLFCVNEGREDYNENSPSKYKMVAIVDLNYLGDPGTVGTPEFMASQRNAPQMDGSDYTFSAFNLSLVDAEGSYSQDWDGYSGGHEPVGWAGTLNAGWTQETWSDTARASQCGNVKVYGSTSMTEDSWTEIAQVPASEIWAKDQDRGFPGENRPISSDANYVRLKFEYESTKTCALRIGYQIRLKPEMRSRYSLQNVEKKLITTWTKYMGYKDGSADPLMDFGRWPVSDTGSFSSPEEAGTMERSRVYDYDMSSITQFDSLTGTWDNGHSMRNFAKIILGSDVDSAGMLYTQALYDSTGTLVGDTTDVSISKNASFALQKEATNVSEVVYTISGAITDGSSSSTELEEYRTTLDPSSPYRATKMRYYVILPPGMKLSESTEGVRPANEGSDEFLSTVTQLYANENQKQTQGGQVDIPTTDATIPSWKRASENGSLSEMMWDESGTVKLNRSLSKDNLVVFDRTLVDECKADRFNLWGPEGTMTNFWGRGLSFSVVPKNGVATLPAGKYTALAWSQFLDEGDRPIPLDGFAKNDDDQNAGELNKKLDTPTSEDSLVYTPMSFKNLSTAGATHGSISLDKLESDPSNCDVTFDEKYRYLVQYTLDEFSSKDVVLWVNLEQKDGVKPHYEGICTGVDFEGVPAEDKSKMKVYVRTSAFDGADYKAKKASKSWLDDPSKGWTLVPDPSSYDWSNVKAIAFSFDGVTFKLDEKDYAYVHINMKAKPETDYVVRGNTGVTRFEAKSPLVFSDTHQENNGDGRDISNFTVANEAPIALEIDMDVPWAPSVDKKIVDVDGEPILDWDWVSRPFEFTIASTDGPVPEPAKVKTDAKGLAKWEEVNLVRRKTYHYTVNEVKGLLPGVTYDTKAHNLTVQVSELGEITWSWDATIDTPVITNVYSPDVARGFGFTKKFFFENSDDEISLEGDEFTFDIVAVNPEDAPMPAQHWAKNDASGHVQFSDIVFKKPGEYEYEVVERKDPDAEDIVYDEDHHRVVMKVKKNVVTRELEVDITWDGVDAIEHVPEVVNYKRTASTLPSTGGSGTTSTASAIGLALVLGGFGGMLVPVALASRKSKRY